MTIEKIIYPTNGLHLRALGNRYFEVVKPTYINVVTDAGEIEVTVRHDFVTNFRRDVGELSKNVYTLIGEIRAERRLK